MALTKMLKVISTALFFSTSVLARDVANSSQQVITNTVADANIDLAKVQKFKSLFNQQQEKSLLGRNTIDPADVLKWQNIFNDLHTWTDVLDGSVPLSALCSERCLDCAAGCNPICCLVDGVSLKPDPQLAGSGEDDPADKSDGDQISPKIPETIFFSTHPFPASLACPCHCEESCPAWIQDACCSTSEAPVDPTADEKEDGPKVEHPVAEKDGQKPLSSPNEKFGWRPRWPLPLDCPCTCEPGCLYYTVCCFTPGFNISIGSPRHPVPPNPLICPCTCEPGCQYADICCFTPGFAGEPELPSPPPPLECPCTCEDDCPYSDICCFTPGSNVRLGNPDHAGPSPQECPCTCEPDCPASVQAICCNASGSNTTVHEADESKSTLRSHKTLALVMETATGDPVSVWAAVNLTVFDSFITMDLVQGLERASEITAQVDQGLFEIALNVVVGPRDKEQALRQSFRVIHGSMLMEKEQVMLGLGFMARINSLAVQKEFLTTPEEGLPLLTGARENSA